MKKAVWIVCVLGLASSECVSASVLRDSVKSLWPAQGMQMDGRAAPSQAAPVLEEEGFGFQAMNDASNLYVLILGENHDEEMILSGHYGQDVTLWFVKPDETSRAWGVDFDFSHRHPPEDSSGSANGTSVTLSSIGVVPECVNPQGLVLSTAALSSGMEVKANLFHQNGQQTLYEIKIPLNLIEHQGDQVLMDFVTSEVNPSVIARLQAGRSAQSSSDGGGDSTGASRGGRHHKGGGSQGGGRSQTIEAPNPVDLHLAIVLTKKPQ